jgi:hypothetical protein
MVDVCVVVKKRKGPGKRKFRLSKDPECGIPETPLRQCIVPGRKHPENISNPSRPPFHHFFSPTLIVFRRFTSDETPPNRKLTKAP